MSFHEVRFPARLSYGSSGGPMRQTDIVALANGFEHRNSPWEHSRRQYNAGLGLRSLDDVGELIAFFEARRGRLHGFRWKDWLDYKSCRSSKSVSCTDQVIAQTDGQTTNFHFSKAYASGGITYRRPITKIVPESVVLAVDGTEVPNTEYDLHAETGMVQFMKAPSSGAILTAGFEFDVPARFDTDSIISSIASFQAGDILDIPVVELRT
ncbi:DUF2460 domain-containing protein [uncultured Jannaschia sp.]|uniref:DUF2460 domain-containing protein n=1 Tax=uncultured Jannaschia sp. TaxID=293347 RepID=UPI002606A26B|nr:DUF2460 domain-containing protein [uncultured Jannaschia sp.]